MTAQQNPIGKLQTMIHEDGLQNWLPTLLAIFILSILPIAVIAFITLIDRKGDSLEAEKGQMGRSQMWEDFRETEPSEPEQKNSEMGRQIRIAFDPPSEYTSPGQTASGMVEIAEEAIDPAHDHAGTVRKRKLSMVEV